MDTLARCISDWSIVIHGGAGHIAKGIITPRQESAYRDALTETLHRAGKILNSGGSAVDAVEAAVCAMEDDTLFNAGRGAVFTAEGRNELDAAIMDGRNLAAGAVAGVTRTRHPVSLARAVMEQSPHVMLAGEGADSFAHARGLELVEPAYFFSERRWHSLEIFLAKNGLPVPSKPVDAKTDPRNTLVHDEGKFGTVGAVALDRQGHVAAATSTGGTTGKRWGRVGDSPIIGAGCYASDSSCGVSCTGDGEYFQRLVMGHAIASCLQQCGTTLQMALDQMVQHELTAIGGTGGVIAITRDGQMAWSFNTEGMYRARLAQNLPAQVSLYRTDF